jgi:heat shock protein HslJ
MTKKASMTVSRLVMAAVLACAASACSNSNDSLLSPSNTAPLDGTWRLTRMTSAAGVHDEALSANRFNVTFTGSSLSAKVDCNRCGGSSTLADNTLTLGPLACTRAACQSSPIDTQFEALLSGTKTVTVSDRVLVLSGADGSALRFEK